MAPRISGVEPARWWADSAETVRALTLCDRSSPPGDPEAGAPSPPFASGVGAGRSTERFHTSGQVAKTWKCLQNCRGKRAKLRLPGQLTIAFPSSINLRMRGERPIIGIPCKIQQGVRAIASASERCLFMPAEKPIDYRVPRHGC